MRQDPLPRRYVIPALVIPCLVAGLLAAATLIPNSHPCDLGQTAHTVRRTMALLAGAAWIAWLAVLAKCSQLSSRPYVLIGVLTFVFVPAWLEAMVASTGFFCG